MDSMEITILEDGRIKVETGPVSAPNHMTAEAFMRNMAQACGGKQERKHKHGMLGAAAHAAKHALGMGHES
ncbi:MAG: hypothetical protein A2Y76_01570 [Planctomycetes bacterium RBG_13_60_9]|nr:MAG: hypothetical protein A2Y76_01570 [Planctomycetes bacterium RBG_13_60_9]